VAGDHDGSGVAKVEIKVTVDAARIDDAERAFGLDGGETEQQRVWFAECASGPGVDAEPALLARGVILRARTRAADGESTVKVRAPAGGVDPRRWHAWIDRAGAAVEGLHRIEGDWAGDRRLVSASLDAGLDSEVLDRIRTGSAGPIVDLFSRAQRDLLADLLVGLDEARLLGPVLARKWGRARRDGIAHPVVAERWEVDDLRFLELSIRVERDRAPEAQRQLREAVTSRGITLTAQETKTKTVIDHLLTRSGGGRVTG
jgi:hypothetical protein